MSSQRGAKDNSAPGRPAKGASDTSGQGPGQPNGQTTAPPINKAPARGARSKVNTHANKIIPIVRYPPVAKKTNGTHQETETSIEQSVRKKAVCKQPCALSPADVPLGVDVKVERQVTEAVEVITRGQSKNPAWFAWRHNRITASNAHRVAHSRFANRRSAVPPQSYLASITGGGANVRTRAMTWGVENEPVAVRSYCRLKSEQLGRDIQVQECGLFIHPQQSWLAASPDGIVLDQRRRLCLEVKCPYKHRERTVRQACLEDRTFCLELEEAAGGDRPQYRLKTGHSYYTQIQCQLAVTGMQRADLVVFTLKETAIVPVTFNPQFWKETVDKLERFYRDGVLPRLRQERMGPPAIRPEE